MWQTSHKLEGIDWLNAKRTRGCQGKKVPEDRGKLTIRNAAGWTNMVPSPGWKAMRGGNSKVSFGRALVPTGLQAHSSSFTRGKRRWQTCIHPFTLAPAGKSALWVPPRMSEEVTVLRANTEEPRAPNTRRPGGKHSRRTRARSVTSGAAAGEGSGQSAPHSPAPALPGPRPGRGEKFPGKVRRTRSRSQPPKTTVSRPGERPTPAWPWRQDPRSHLPQPAPAAEVHLPQSREKSSSGKSSSSSGGGVGGGSRSPAPGGEAEESCALPPPGHSGAGPGVRAIPHPPPGPLARPPPGSPGPGASGGGRRQQQPRRGGDGRSGARVPNSQF